MDCDIVREEIKKAGARKSRVVALTTHFLGTVPFSSRGAYSVHFIPRRHVPRFSELTQEEIADLSIPLYKEMQKMAYIAPKNLKFDAVNIAIHSLPFYSVGDPSGFGIVSSYHTHIEIFTGNFPNGRKETYEIPGSKIFVSKVRPKDMGSELRI